MSTRGRNIKQMSPLERKAHLKQSLTLPCGSLGLDAGGQGMGWREVNKEK